MPLVRVEIIKGRSLEYKKAIMDSVHAALVETFKIPEEDRMQALYELDPELMEYRPAYTDQITRVEITAFAGRSVETKRALYAAIVRNLESRPGIPKKAVFIVLHDEPKENWGIRGGQSAADVDLGFKIDV